MRKKGRYLIKCSSGEIKRDDLCRDTFHEFPAFVTYGKRRAEKVSRLIIAKDMEKALEVANEGVHTEIEKVEEKIEEEVRRESNRRRRNKL